MKSFIAQLVAKNPAPNTAAEPPAPAANPVQTVSGCNPDAEVRAALDARAPDVLACVNEARALLEASVDGGGAIAVLVRGKPAEDPIQGCVRSVLGPLKAACGPAVVVHLVRGPASPAVP